MPNVIEERGQFWWFGEEGPTSSLEDSVHGLLRISEEGHITLQLEGPLSLTEPFVPWGWGDPSRWLSPEKRIIGRLGKSGEKGYVLLHGIFRTDSSFSDEPARQSFEVDFCFKHDLSFPLNFDLDHFSAFRVELEGLEEWLQLEAIELGRALWHQNHVEFTVKYDEVEIEYDTERAKVSIETIVLGAPVLGLGRSRIAEADIRQTNWLVYQPKEPLSLPQLQMSFRRVEEFITLLLGQYFRLDWPKLIARFGEYDEWFTLYWKRGRRHETSPSFFFMMTKFPEIREDFGEMLDRWERGSSKYGAGYGLYMASLQQPLPYPEHEFVNLVWAIESLHRGWQRDAEESPNIARRRKRIEEILSRFRREGDNKLHQWLAGKLKYAYESTLENRIVESLKRLPFELDLNALRVFAKRCAQKRNNISHEGGCRPEEDAEAFRSELRVLAGALRYLFHALLLHEVGLSRDLLLKAFTRNGIGSMIVIPALREAGFELSSALEESSEAQP